MRNDVSLAMTAATSARRRVFGPSAWRPAAEPSSPPMRTMEMVPMSPLRAHTNVDIPGIVDAARGRHPGTRFEQLPHLGADPAILGLLAAQLDAATG